MLTRTDTTLSIAIVGAGIQMMPNSMKVLRQIGIEELVRATWIRGGNDDTSWLYAYDAWNVPLNEPALHPAS